MDQGYVGAEGARQGGAVVQSHDERCGEALAGKGVMGGEDARVYRGRAEHLGHDHGRIVILRYVGSDETRLFGYSVLGMVAGSIALQLVLSIFQNYKKPSALVAEVALTLTGLRPAWDAFLVSSGKEVEEHHSIDTKTMLVLGRCKEVSASPHTCVN